MRQTGPEFITGVGMIRKYILAVILFLALSSTAASQTRKLKVYISVDMEGVVGVVTEDQLAPGGFEYPKFREFMTKEALAAIGAAKEAGATEILVSDSHGNGENLLIEMLPRDVRVIRSWPRRLSMMAGIDDTFDAALFVGYHSSTSNPKGVRAHTFSSARLTRVALNGIEMTEGAWNAAIAGHYGVPVIFLSGDDAVIREVRSVVGTLEAAEVKKSLGFHSANTISPEAAYDLIGQRVTAAIGRLKDFRPFVLKSPLTLDVSFKHYRVAEVLAYLKGVQRIDAHSIRYVGKDMIEIADFMLFLTTYSFNLEP